MINVEQLSKHFGPKTAVDGISFSVEKGEVLGFLGPNGAGKSTTMRMVTGYIPPTSGKVTVGGHNMWTDSIPAKKLIGYLPENAPAYTDMTVMGFLKFAAEIRGLSGADRGKAVDRVVEMCFLENVLHQSVDTLSKGYLHRTCFAQSIIHDPEILILDEPTDGLDPNQKHEVRNIIRRMGEKKVIVFSTHILEEVEAVCTRAIIIDRGKIVANGSPTDLKKQADAAGSVLVRVSGATKDAVSKTLGAVAGAATAKILSAEGQTIEARILPGGDGGNGALARAIAEAVNKEGWKMEELHTEQGRLDDVFRSITRPDTAKEAA